MPRPLQLTGFGAAFLFFPILFTPVILDRGYMNNLHLLNKAVSFATSVHRTQKRKGSDIPYITHALAVSLILSKLSKVDNIVIAGILHDTIEDCEPYGSITKAFLAKEFNPKIASIVDDLTEQDKTLPWDDRKMAALHHIKDMPKSSILVKSADVLHNLMSLNDDIEKDKVKAFSKFNAPKEKTIGRYGTLIPELRKAWDGNPLMKDLEYEFERLYRLSNQ